MVITSLLTWALPTHPCCDGYEHDLIKKFRLFHTLEFGNLHWVLTMLLPHRSVQTADSMTEWIGSSARSSVLRSSILIGCVCLSVSERHRTRNGALPHPFSLLCVRHVRHFTHLSLLLPHLPGVQKQVHTWWVCLAWDLPLLLSLPRFSLRLCPSRWLHTSSHLKRGGVVSQISDQTSNSNQCCSNFCLMVSEWCTVRS